MITYYSKNTMYFDKKYKTIFVAEKYTFWHLWGDYMKVINKKIDINAHIENVSSNVILEKGNAVAIINFSNLWYGDITAIKFDAIGYNAFGDVVTIGNKKNFILIIQDVKINKNENVKNFKVKLPIQDIRKIDLKEVQICYADGMVLTYQGEKYIDVELEEYDDSDKEQLEAIHKMYDERIKYRAKEIDDGWICGCGRYNQKEEVICSLCGKSKEETFDVTSDEGIQKITESYIKKIENDKEKAKLNKQKIKVKVGIGIVIVSIFVGIIGNSHILSEREIYESVEEMQSALKGMWVYKSVSGNVLKRLTINDDTGIEKYDITGDEFEGQINWNPSRGKFDFLGSKFVIEKGGEVIKEGDYTYTKGGMFRTVSSNKSFESTPDSLVKDPYKDLKIKIDTVSSNSSYSYCTGSVKNNGTKTYKFVKVKAAFKDSADDVVDTDWTYVVGDEGLAPGEASTFKVSVPKNSKIRSCEVSLLDWD